MQPTTNTTHRVLSSDLAALLRKHGAVAVLQALTSGAEELTRHIRDVGGECRAYEAAAEMANSLGEAAQYAHSAELPRGVTLADALDVLADQ